MEILYNNSELNVVISLVSTAVLSAPTVVLDELIRRTEQLKKLHTELKNQFITWKPVRKCTRALLTELATKLSISSSTRNVGTATVYGTIGAVIVPIMVAILMRLGARFGARFGFPADAARVDAAVTIGAGVIGAAVGAAGGAGGFGAAVGALVGFAGGTGAVAAAFGVEFIGLAIVAGALGGAVGAAVGTSGGDNVKTVGAVLGSAISAHVVGYIGVRSADGDDNLETGMCAVFGLAFGAAVGSALGAAGTVAAVGATVGVAVGVLIICKIAFKFGGVCFVVGAVVFALLGASLGALIGVLVVVLLGVPVGALVWNIVFLAVKVLAAAGASEAAVLSVSLISLAVIALIGAVNGTLNGAVVGIKVGLEIAFILGGGLDVLVNLVVLAAFGAGVGAKVAIAVEKYVTNTYRMKRVHHAIDKDRKTYQELKAKEDNLGQSVADFAVFCCQHNGLVLSSELVEDEFRFLLDILRRTRRIPPNAAAEGAAPRSTLRHEDVNIRLLVSNLLKQLHPSTSDQEALTTIEKILDEQQECPNDEEIQRRIIDFMETKFAEACTSQL